MADSSMMRTRVKMCGTTSLGDALAAVRYGVDALGFIFYDKSPRFIAADQAGQIIKNLPPFVDRVGVFVNAPMEEVITTAGGVGLSWLQLHGRESVEYCQQIRQQLPSCGIIKAFRVGDKSQPEDFTPYNGCVDAFLLDTYVAGTEGGTGKIFNWSIIAQLRLLRPIILAGGLTPDNIVHAVDIAQPFAVDVNSGVESQPGIKDHALLKALLELIYRTI